MTTRRKLFYLGIFPLLAVAIIVLAQLFGTPVSAAPAEPVKACDPWMKAGATVVYKCQDDFSDDRCYVLGGMMFCLQ